jgi:hypothetical protein
VRLNAIDGFELNLQPNGYGVYMDARDADGGFVNGYLSQESARILGEELIKLADEFYAKNIEQALAEQWEALEPGDEFEFLIADGVLYGSRRIKTSKSEYIILGFSRTDQMDIKAKIEAGVTGIRKVVK